MIVHEMELSSPVGTVLANVDDTIHWVALFRGGPEKIDLINRNINVA